MTTYKKTINEIQLKLKKSNIHSIKITRSQDVADYLREYIFNRDTLEINEEFVMLLLNRNNNVTGWFRVSSGGISETIVDPKMIFTVALQSGAASIIISHNHPSNSISPSNLDLKITKQIVDGGKLLTIDVLDHLIITEEDYYSFADNGQI